VSRLDTGNLRHDGDTSPPRTPVSRRGLAELCGAILLLDQLSGCQGMPPKPAEASFGLLGS
jgi:hypothetical protein